MRCGQIARPDDKISPRSGTTHRSCSAILQAKSPSAKTKKTFLHVEISDEISPTVGLSALLAIFGRQTKAFEPTIPKGPVDMKVFGNLFSKSFTQDRRTTGLCDVGVSIMREVYTRGIKKLFPPVNYVQSILSSTNKRDWNADFLFRIIHKCLRFLCQV